MKLQTKLNLKPQEAQNTIDYNSQLVLLGSCFAENIAEKLRYFKFQQFSNPLGILFHPKAIENLIQRSVTKQWYSKESIFYHNEQWQCFEAHSKLNQSESQLLLQELNNAISETAIKLKAATHIIITLGTSWVYKHKASSKIVANCHKMPQKSFDKALLTIRTISESLEAIVAAIQKINQHAKIIFTISPVRHLKDGFVENQRSKSHLLAALHNFLQTSVLKNVFYFESYEIQLDELRDYRFYKDDMVHPNAIAVNYIWEKFTAVWMSAQAQMVMKKVQIIQQGLLHQPFNPQSNAYQKFKQDLDEKIKLLKKDYPFIEF